MRRKDPQPERRKMVREIRRGDLAEVVKEEALRLVEEEGPDVLNLRRLHERLGKGVSKTAPLHHFGSMAGLYAAVGIQGFDHLTLRLRRERESRPPTRGLVKEMAVMYGRFGLERPHLYRVMHWPAVWDRAAQLGLGIGLSGPPVEASAEATAEATWLYEVTEARNRAFAEFYYAVQLGQAAGALRARSSAIDVARVLTALVDGFLFQTLVERVLSDAPVEILRDVLDQYVKMAIDGLGQPRKRGR